MPEKKADISETRREDEMERLGLWGLSLFSIGSDKAAALMYWLQMSRVIGGRVSLDSCSAVPAVYLVAKLMINLHKSTHDLKE